MKMEILYQGREQYEIKIVAKNKNLFNEEWILGKLQEGEQGELLKDDISSSTDFIKVIPGQSYKFNKRVHVLLYDKNKEYLGSRNGYLGIIAKNTSFNVKNAEYIRLYRYTEGRENAILSFDKGDLKDLEYIKMQEEVYSIIIPTQLKKVGDISDRLYWDNNKGRYIIEKNIDKMIIPSYKTWNYREQESSDIVRFFISSNFLNVPIKSGSPVICNTLENISYEKLELFNDRGIGVKKNDVHIDIGINLYKNELEDEGSVGLSMWIENNPTEFLYQRDNPYILTTSIREKLLIPTYNEKTHIYVETENGVNPILKVTVDRINRIAQDAVTEIEEEPVILKLSLARNIVNQMEESELKEELQQRLNNITNLDDLQLERKTSTSNVDIYIKSDNMLSMTLSTNSVTFEDYSGVDNLEIINAINISINSSLPYQLNSYLVSEIENADGTKIIDKDRLNIKDRSEVNYNNFTAINSKLVLKDNCNAGNNLLHNIDLMLQGGNAYEADVYKTVVKFEAEQK